MGMWTVVVWILMSLRATTSTHRLLVVACGLVWFPWPVTSLDDLDWLTLRTERAQILASSTSYKHLVTSSTLSWARIEDVVSGRIPSSLVLLVGDSAVCRVRDGSRLRAGRTDLSGSCIAGPGWVKHSNYQVLVNPTRLSRYEWKYWDMYRLPELGTLAFNDNTFVASLELEDGRELVGELDFNRGLNGNIKAYVTETKTELSTQGTALVEIEPANYILENVELNRKREKADSRTVLLGQMILERNNSSQHENDWEYVQGSIEYSHPVSQYWGHIPGTVTGLPAKLKSSDRSFSWGLEWSGVEEGEWTFGEYLLPDTRVNVTLQGEETKSELPFTATLVQIYQDGKEVEVKVKGKLVETRLEFIRQVAQEPVFTESGLAAPVRPTTTTTTTTTTTPTTSTSSLAPLMSDSSVWDVNIDNSTSENNESEITAFSRSPTLFPPTEPTASTVNPLRIFYPIEDEEPEDDILTAAKFHDVEQLANSATTATAVVAGLTQSILLALLLLK